MEKTEKTLHFKADNVTTPYEEKLTEKTLNEFQKGVVPRTTLTATEIALQHGNIDLAFEKAIVHCTENERWHIKQKRIDFFNKQANLYLKKDKRHSALKTFERLLSFNLAHDEKLEVQKHLLHLYSISQQHALDSQSIK